jgi:hypothetical protein
MIYKMKFKFNRSQVPRSNYIDKIADVKLYSEVQERKKHYDSWKWSEIPLVLLKLL